MANPQISLLLVQITGLLICLSHGSQIADKITAQLTQFVNEGLGVQEYQNYLDNDVTFTKEVLDPKVFTKQVAESMSARLQIKIDALMKLRDGIENLYGSVTTNNPYKECCNIPVYERYPLLNNKMVNLKEWCTVGQQLSKAREFLPPSILDIVKAQYNKAIGVKYAYFSSDEGVLFNYPSLRVCDPNYDPRFRPWYVEAATPKPKDIVVVLDRSGSMSANDIVTGQSLMKLAKDAAITVMDTLNPNDRVGIVQFSNVAEVPTGLASTSTCYSTVLAKATGQNKDYLTRYINGIFASGYTFYTKGMERAFQYFRNTPPDVNDMKKRDKLILFLTDGKPSEPNSNDIYDLIAKENAKLNNSVVIFTYSLGNDVDRTTLEKMAKQINNNPVYGEIKQGIYTAVTDASNLRSSMASYYEQFKQTGFPSVIFNVPYVDAFGTGLLLSMMLPINYQGKFKGVVGIDLSVDDMLSEVTYFNEGESAYGFIIDSTSRVLTHPLITYASEVTNHPYFIYLNTLESGIQDVTSSMVSGGNGTKVVASRRIIPRGNVLLEGIDRFSISSTYSWYPIKNTDFSICFVIGIDEHKAAIEWSGQYPSYLSHRLSLSRVPLNKCKQFTRAAIKDRAGVFFAARSFKNPYLHLNTNETHNTLDAYETYLTGATSRNPGFKDSVRETLAATAQFDSILSTRKGYDLYTVWRYLATNNGIYINFPTVEVPKYYDATRRPWFVRAKANKGLIVVTTPYTDAFGSGAVVSLNKVIYEGNKQGVHTPLDESFGVMGIDFTIQYFYYSVIGSIEMCQQYICFVIDKAGFIVSHKDWIASATSVPKTADVHISEYEQYIASELIKKRVLVSDGCVNIEKLRDQYFWKVTASLDIIESTYELHVLTGSNIFLIIKKQSGSASCTSCSPIYSSCAYNFQQGCFCPCYQKANIYLYCLGKFDFSGDTLQPCTPALPVIDYSEVSKIDAIIIQTLSNCTNYACRSPNKSTPGSCNSVISCSWCQYHQGKSISNPYCSTQSVCPFGALSHRYSGGDNGNGSSTTEGQVIATWLIAIIVIIPVIVIVAAILLCYFKCRKSTSPPNTEAAHSPTPVSSTEQRPPATAPHFTNLAFQNNNHKPPVYHDLIADSTYLNVNGPWWIANIVIILVVAIVAAILLWYFKYRKGKSPSHTKSPTQLASTEQQPPVFAPQFNNLSFQSDQHITPPAYGDVFPDFT